ncbi:hypothetical protein ACIQPP_39025 [Streptomyces violaceusniger]|uniref:hypothetical protein n=1 Tax=Streptomyces violaceusniger TaxID=68280 RepID=UPI0009977C83|nr:hypothetical protein SHXM_09591 [Streptomyces hygroscopicus]
MSGRRYWEFGSATFDGLVVKSPPICRIVNHGHDFVRCESDPPESSDHDLQAATLEKIFASDLVYVVNPGGYIGRTTAYELGCVHERGMAVYYAEPPKDLPIAVPERTVVDARHLVEIIAESDPGPAPVRRPRVAAQPTADRDGPRSGPGRCQWGLSSLRGERSTVTVCQERTAP